MTCTISFWLTFGFARHLHLHNYSVADIFVISLRALVCKHASTSKDDPIFAWHLVLYSLLALAITHPQAFRAGEINCNMQTPTPPPSQDIHNLRVCMCVFSPQEARTYY